MAVPRNAFSKVRGGHAPTTVPEVRAVGGWVEALRNSDAGRLWSELRRVVKRHPLLRSPGALVLFGGDAGGAYSDLTQELFVRLLIKGRFQHYLDAGMSDEEVENQVARIELTNLLNEQLRRLRPESYRLARRVAVLLQSGSAFRCIPSAAARGRRVKLANQVFGLRRWSDGKPTREAHELELRAGNVPARGRDRRRGGRGGDSELVISNRGLEGLVVAVLEACDAPVELGTLRRLVLSRLHLSDPCVVAFPPGRGGESDLWPRLADDRPDAEQVLLKREAESGAAAKAGQFLDALNRAVGGKPRRYRRMLEILWRYYLGPGHVTQLEVATALGVSDSLVSDYRRRLEAELRALRFEGVEEARGFEESLRARLSSDLRNT